MLVIAVAAVWPLLQYTGTANDVRWHCRNGTYMVPTGSNGLVDIVMVDTNPFLSRYKKKDWYNNAGGCARAPAVVEVGAVQELCAGVRRCSCVMQQLLQWLQATSAGQHSSCVSLHMAYYTPLEAS
jgi:hypothetical protein